MTHKKWYKVTLLMQHLVNVYMYVLLLIILCYFRCVRDFTLFQIHRSLWKPLLVVFRIQPVHTGVAATASVHTLTRTVDGRHLHCRSWWRAACLPSDVRRGWMEPGIPVVERNLHQSRRQERPPDWCDEFHLKQYNKPIVSGIQCSAAGFRTADSRKRC